MANTKVKAEQLEAAQTSITSVGTLTALQVDNLNLNGNTVSSTDTNGNITIAPNGTGDIYANTDKMIVLAAEGESATLMIVSDESDDNGDDWSFVANQSNNTLTIENDISGSSVSHLTITPHATVASSTVYVPGKVGVGISAPATELQVTKASSGATPTAGTVVTIEDDDNTELSILGGSSSVLAINFGHSGDNDEGKITFNTTAGSEDLQLVSSKAITLDAAGDITLDADDGDIYLKDGGTTFGQITTSSGDFHLLQPTSDKDIILRGLDGSTYIEALKLDMSEVGSATFSGAASFGAGLPSGTGIGASGVGGDLRLYSAGNQYVTINTAGNVDIVDGNLGFASGHGIDFGLTGNSSGNLGSELFDDYEEGTWTPILISGGSTNPTGGGALAPSGRYTKIGNRCFITFYVGRSWTNSPSGGIVISGLPFTIHASTNGYYTPCTTYMVSYGSGGTPFLIPSANDTTLYLYATSNGGTWPQMVWQTHAASTAGTYVTGTLSYHV